MRQNHANRGMLGYNNKTNAVLRNPTQRIKAECKRIEAHTKKKRKLMGLRIKQTRLANEEPDEARLTVKVQNDGKDRSGNSTQPHRMRYVQSRNDITPCAKKSKLLLLTERNEELKKDAS